ncbi:MAG: ABC transporter ATP-binding protein [Planctomycetota bacterium]
MTAPLLTIDGLRVSFGQGPGRARVQAVDGARLTLHERQTVAVVGESGCGKSVTAMSVLGLVPSPPARVDAGEIRYRWADGRETRLERASSRELRRVRGGEIAMIFQEPMTSLNPVTTIGEQLVEAIRLHRVDGGGRRLSGRAARSVAVDALAEVGIPDPAARLAAYPHQFSGGMRQRVMIAMALACEPRVLLADEPTTALDVTIQKQILDLIGALKRDRGLGVVLITHDLGVVAHHADVVCVMYAGRIVEYSRVDELFRRPTHPYTRGLLACIPRLDDEQTPGEPLPLVGDLMSQDDAFRPLETTDASAVATPWWPGREPAGLTGPTGPATDDSLLVPVGDEHWVACWATPGLSGTRSADLCVVAPRAPAGAATA